jgi:hypothetical protein
MIDWFIVLAPLAILSIFMLFSSCTNNFDALVSERPDDNGDATPPPEDPPPDPPPDYIQYQLTASAALRVEPGVPDFTFFGVNIGNEMPGRHVIVAASVATEVGDPGFAITGVTIDGDLALDAGGYEAISGNVVVAVRLFILPVNTGTAADIVVTCDQTAPNWGVIVWAVYGLISSTPSDKGIDSLPPEGGALSVGPLNLATGGLLIAAATSYHPGSVPMHEWDSTAGEDVDEGFSGNTTSHSGYSMVFQSPPADVSVTPLVTLPDGPQYATQSVLVAATFN